MELFWSEFITRASERPATPFLFCTVCLCRKSHFPLLSLRLIIPSVFVQFKLPRGARLEMTHFPNTHTHVCEYVSLHFNPFHSQRKFEFHFHPYFSEGWGGRRGTVGRGKLCTHGPLCCCWNSSKKFLGWEEGREMKGIKERTEGSAHIYVNSHLSRASSLFTTLCFFFLQFVSESAYFEVKQANEMGILFVFPTEEGFRSSNTPYYSARWYRVHLHPDSPLCRERQEGI